MLFLNININWNTGTSELEEYAQNVEALRRKVGEWERRFRMFGVRDKPTLAGRLKVARSLWEKEQNR